MSDKQQASRAHTEEKTFADKLNDFLRKNRIGLLVAAIIIAVTVIGIGVVGAYNQNKLEKSTLALEELEASFDTWAAAKEEEKAGLSVDLLNKAESLIASYSGTYAGSRAFVVQGRVHASLKDYSAAEKAYLSVVQSNPKSHLAPVSLANASAMAEERGDRDAALVHLTKLIETYPEATGVARARFTVGRLHEEAKAYDKAVEAYNALSAEDSDWTKLAKDRIIFLRAQGLTK